MKSFNLTKITSAFALVFIGVLLFADQKGDRIAKKVYGIKEADDSYAVATMILIDKKGNKKTRKIEMYTKKTEEGQNTFIEFLEPADVKGTKFLTIAHKNSDDEQRIYLSALKKVRMISSSNKDGEFMGSDLYYYDMEDRDYEDHTYQLLEENAAINDKAFDGMNFYVLEVVPKDKDAPYSRTKMWVNKDSYFVYKIEAYDKKYDRLLKTIMILEVKNIKGVLTATKTIVINNKEGSKTLLAMNEIKINIGIKESIFTVRNLEK